MSATDTHLLTTAELAKFLSRTPTTISIWNRRGIITPEVSAGRGAKMLFSLDRVMRQLAKHARAKQAARKIPATLAPGMVPVI